MISVCRSARKLLSWFCWNLGPMRDQRILVQILVKRHVKEYIHFLLNNAKTFIKKASGCIRFSAEPCDCSRWSSGAPIFTEVPLNTSLNPTHRQYSDETVCRHCRNITVSSKPSSRCLLSRIIFLWTLSQIFTPFFSWAKLSTTTGGSDRIYEAEASGP